MAKWIGFTEARHLIEDHAERSNLGATPVATAHYIYDSLISLMIDGVVKSRSRVPSSFRLHFTSNIDPKSFQIDADDYLPIIFWISWRDVIEEAQKGMMSGHNQDAYFSSEGDNFQFRLAIGLRDNGVLEGFAQDVELLRESIPLLPRERGRKPGNQYDDTAAIDFAVAKLRLGEDWAEVIPVAVSMMRGASEKAKRNRLLVRLKPLGFIAPRSQKRSPFRTNK